MKALALFLLALAVPAQAQVRFIGKPSKSPLVTFRIVFNAGSALDLEAKRGLAYLTANLLAEGGTKALSYQQIADILFPMAASFSAQVDKEMVVFTGITHVDNLDAYYRILRDRLLDPGFREDDFRRVRDDAVNAITEGLRNNDEELAKEVLYDEIYRGTPYAGFNGGTVETLGALTIEDVRRFYRTHYSRSNLYVGLAGGYPPAFAVKVKEDFRALPEGGGFRPRRKAPAMIGGNRAVLVEKDTRSTAFSIGYPIGVTRSHADFPALLLAASYFGQHRMSGGVLYEEMREKRGLNYGDYAYVEYFPRGMYLMEPSPNLARRYQIFQLWIRPVEPANAKFALRMALYQLDQLIREGLSKEEFERTRDYLVKNVNFLTRTQNAELGYSIDSIWYGISGYNDYLKAALAKLTVEDVNRALKGHLRANRVVITAVTKDAAALKAQLASEDASPIAYNSAKPEEVLKVDKTVEKWPLHLSAEDIKIVPVDRIF